MQNNYLPRNSSFIPRTRRGHGSAHSPICTAATPEQRQQAAARGLCSTCGPHPSQAAQKAHSDAKGNRADWESDHRTSFPADR